VITLEHHDDAPRGRRYGTLVHAALATVPLDADGDTIRRITATQARIAAASPLELASATTVVSAVLRHPLLEAARQADALGRCRRETPVTLVRDGVLIEGVVDLAFETADGMTVVDFKTDRAEGELLDQYRQQVDVYGQAIAQATGKPVKAVLMSV
jgi:ATP-dependent exoDNAse (exonuclease V) beta subunit